MSEPTPPNEPPANEPSPPAEPTPPSAAAPPKAPPPAAAKRSRVARWRHRWAVLFWTVAILFIVFRIAVSIAMPTVLRRVAAYYDLHCTYDRLQLSFSGGQATLWHVALTPKGGGERLVYADYVHGNIDPFQLLRGRLIVWRAEVDGTEMAVDRRPDGSIPLLDHFVAQKAASATAATQSAQAHRPIVLDAPLRVDAVRVTHLVAHLHDQSVSPPVDSRLVLDVRASELGQRDRPTPFEISLSADGLLEQLRITGEKRGDRDKLDADVTVAVRGLRLKPAAGYLQPLGIIPVADDVDARLRAHVTAVATTRPNAPPSLSGAVALRDIALIADGREAVGLDRLSIDVLSLDSRSAQLGKLAIDGVRVNGSRGENGNVRLAGIELVPTTQPAEAATRPVVANAAKPRYQTSLRGFGVGHVHLRFDDRAVSPPVSLTASIDELNSKDFTFDPQHPDAPMNVGGTFRVPGFAESITVAGSLTPFAERKSLDLTLDLTGLRPDLLKPYLDTAGIESLYRAGTLHCRLTGAARVDATGRLAADGQLSDLKLADGGKDLLDLNTVRVAGVSVDPTSGVVHADAIDLAGPTLTARRGKDGAITALGFRTRPPAPATQPAVAVASASPGPSSQPAPALPRFELGRFSWKDAHLELTDETVDPPTTLSLGDAGVEAQDITFDLNATHAAKPGTVHAWLTAPGVARRMNVQGTVTPQPNAVTLDLKLAGEGLSGAKVAPYLKPLGIEPMLRDGALALTLRGTLARHGNDLASTLTVQNLKFTDGQTELASLASLTVKDLATAGKETRLGAIDVDRLHLRAARDADGWLSVGGVRIDPNRKSKPSTQPSVISIASATMKDAEVTWADRAVSPAVETTATINLDVRHATLGRNGADPGTLKLALSTADSIGRLTAEGSFLVSPDAKAAKLALTGEGLRQGAFGGYLPPGLALETRDGRLKADVDASAVKNAQGGEAVRIALNDFEWRDGASPLLKLDTVRLNAPRIDPDGKVIAIDELTTSGLDTAARLDAGGIARLAGLAFGPAAAAARQPAPAATARPAPMAPVSATQLAAKAREALPLITIRKLDLGVRKVSLIDATRPASAPLVITDLHLTNPDPIAWLGPDAANLPPTKLNLDGHIAPLVDQLTVRASVAPFALQPSADVAWSLTGIRGEGVMKVAPELSALLDGRPLTDGSFKGHAEAHLTLDRRVANDFDLSKGFALDLMMKGIEFRAARDGPVLLGLDELRTENAHFRPNGSIQVKSLELEKPVGYVLRDHDGLHLLGMAVKVAGQPSASTQPATQLAMSEPTPRPTTEPTSQPLTVAIATPPPTTKPAAEMRIDRLLISGLDLRVEDRTVDPPTILPLTGLDVDVRGLSNWLPYEDKAVRFTVLVSSGKVPLPGRGGKAGGEATAMEERQLFSEAALTGQLALYPQPRGWVKASLNGVEAVGFAGEARPHGVNLGGGTFDASADVRFPGDGSARARARLVANDLLIAEKPNGPVGSALKLNMPLNAAVKLLEAPDGSITVPVSVSVQNGQLHGLGPSAVAAVAGVFAVATASAPLKVATGALSMTGLKLGGKATDLTPVTLPFPAGETGLEPDAQKALATLVERLRKNHNLDVILRHQPGGGDVTAAGRRVNLDPDEAAHFAEGLHAHKLELLRLRAQVAGQARAQLVASSATDADQTIERLKGLDRELSQTEDALDRVYDLLRPGAERQADRRARQATIELGTSRLLAVRATLLASGVPDIDRRIKLTNAQFNPTDDESAGGTVKIELSAAKRKR